MSPFCSTRSSNEELVDSLSPNALTNAALHLLADCSPLHHRCSPQPRRLEEELRVGAGNKSPIGKKRGTGGGTGERRGGARPGGGGPGKVKMCRLGCGQPKSSCKCT